MVTIKFDSMKKYTYMMAAISLFFIGGMQPAGSQNLDPTVEVSRAFVARKIEADKSSMTMAVPDSVLKFDLDFDYSVNDNPYRGAYEFRPYVLEMRPESHTSGGNTFFLRAGAGYSLHPTFDVVYSPEIKKIPFTMSLYGTHRSYVGCVGNVGGYRKLPSSRPVVADVPYVASWNRKENSGYTYSGYNCYTSAGADGRVDWNTGYFSFDAGYLGYADRDFERTRGYDAARADLRVASNRTDDGYFFYDVALHYLYGNDKIYGNYAAKPYLSSHEFSLDATLGPVFTSRQRFLVDIFSDIADYGQALDSFAGTFGITPKYQLFTGRWSFDIGVRISKCFNNSRTDGQPLNTYDGQYVYPDMKIGFDALRKYMNIYLSIGGGENINRYSDMIAGNCHFSYAYKCTGPLLDNTVERVKTVLGFRGNIASRFSYDLRGGYARYKNMACDAVMLDASGDVNGSCIILPCISYTAEFNYYFATLDMKWHSRDVSADVSLKYQGTDLTEKNHYAVAPSPFVAGANIIYNWKTRIFAGIHCNAALARSTGQLAKGDSGEVQPSSVKIPGYADLGVSLEYRINRKISVWLYGGNLLDMTIQRVPFYAESGISATGGITLNL